MTRSEGAAKEGWIVNSVVKMMMIPIQLQQVFSGLSLWMQ